MTVSVDTGTPASVLVHTDADPSPLAGDLSSHHMEVGGNVWGLDNWTSSFSVGDKHVSLIDAAAHSMQVFDNDQLVHTYPVSTGRDQQFPTISNTGVPALRSTAGPG